MKETGDCSDKGLFKCFITQCFKFPGKKRYGGVRFNIISITRGCKISRNQCNT